MSVHFGGEDSDVIDELRQRRSVTVGENADAAGEGLRDVVQFALHGGGEGGQPFVVHHEDLDFGLGELWILFVSELIERGLRVADGAFEIGLLGAELEPFAEDGGLGFGVGIAFDFLEPCADLGLGDLVESAEKLVFTFSTALLLQFGESGSGDFERGLLGVDGGLFGGEIAGDDKRLGHEVAGPALVLGFAFFVGLQNAGGAGHPAVGGDEVAVVLHGRGPVIHEVLIDGVGIDQELAFGVGEQGFGVFANDVLRQAVDLELTEADGRGGAPSGKVFFKPGDEGGELRVAVNRGLELGGGHEEVVVAGAVGLEQGGAEVGADFPVIGEGVDIARGDTAVEVAADILNVLGFLGVDVAGEIEVVVVLRDLLMRHGAGVAGVGLGVGEDIDDLVQVALAEAVFVAVFDEALAGIDHEDAAAGRGVFLVEDEDAGGDAGAVKEIGRQADDAFQDAGANELFADDALGIAAKEDAVRQNAGALAGGALQGADDVEQEGVVALLGRRHSPSEALIRITAAALAQGEAGAPRFYGERGIGDDVVVGAELLGVLEFRFGEGVAREDIRRGKIVQNHVHAGETGGGHVHLLALERDVFAGLGGDLQQQRTGAAGGIVGGGGSLGILRGDADDLGDDAADLGRGVELALRLAALGGEVPHEILVGVTEDIVVVGAVFGEIQFGLLEDADEVLQSLHHGVAFAELVGIVEIGEVGAGESGIGGHEGGDDVLVDAVADVALALEGDHVLEAGTGRDGDGRLHAIKVAVFVGDVFDEEHEQDVVLVLAGIHAAAEFIAGGPKGGVEVGFLNGHVRAAKIEKGDGWVSTRASLHFSGVEPPLWCPQTASATLGCEMVRNKARS